jgi:hypothetical protein
VRDLPPADTRERISPVRLPAPFSFARATREILAISAGIRQMAVNQKCGELEVGGIWLRKCGEVRTDSLERVEGFSSPKKRSMILDFVGFYKKGGLTAVFNFW